ncbi:hypothetical protein DAEQUDRAFT_727637 [Daedalea quercina L-15889]|uniref:DUF6534 domain-containing protein n=1 Tax=Daedalea quercina L-15889 TaxID=1314783 RepID=A0A165PRH9_9APHY|nr:hypothetical protein DAEQUDRAFT_727637 [Daedalea quercina L-15889]
MGPAASLDNLLGATFIGIILSTVIYGITCLQVYLYYTQYCRNDGRAVKLFVAFLMTLDTFHVALLATVYYYYTVTHFGDFVTLQADTWSLSAQVTVGGFLSCLVQFFFAYRLYNFSGKQLWLPTSICIISLGQLGTSTAYTAVGWTNRFFNESQKATPYVTAGLVCDIACDSLIAASMIYFLRKKRTMFHKTQMALDLMITYTLNTCLLTTVFTVICFITWYTETDTLIYSIFYFILVRLYSCSLVSTLNTRDNIKTVLTSDTHELFNLPTATAVAPGSEEGSPGGVNQSKGWAIHRSVTVDISADSITDTPGTEFKDLEGGKAVRLP